MTRLCLIMMIFSLGAAHAAQPFRVVIDPGHGGSDLGAVHDNGRVRITEKDVTLALARQLAKQLKARGYTVVLTRAVDKELSLAERTKLANRIGADIFLSIHMNSTHTHAQADAEGVETYILNNATDATSRRLAHLENAVLTQDQRLTPVQADVSLILKDLRLDANLGESKRLACAVQNNLVAATTRFEAPGVAPAYSPRQRDRGVKQALFHVLLGADMPSVLVEAGFLSSPRDRALVISQEGQRKISLALAKAIDQYRLSKSLTGHPRAGAAQHNAMTSLSRCKVN